MIFGAKVVVRMLRMDCHIDLWRQFTLHRGRLHRLVLSLGGSLTSAPIASGRWLVFWLAHDRSPL